MVTLVRKFAKPVLKVSLAVGQIEYAPRCLYLVRHVKTMLNVYWSCGLRLGALARRSFNQLAAADWSLKTRVMFSACFEAYMYCNVTWIIFEYV